MIIVVVKMVKYLKKKSIEILKIPLKWMKKTSEESRSRSIDKTRNYFVEEIG